MDVLERFGASFGRFGLGRFYLGGRRFGRRRLGFCFCCHFVFPLDRFPGHVVIIPQVGPIPR